MKQDIEQSEATGFGPFIVLNELAGWYPANCAAVASRQTSCGEESSVGEWDD